MLVQMYPGGFHPVATESCYLCFRVTRSDLLHQSRCMQIPRSLACYDEITFNV